MNELDRLRELAGIRTHSNSLGSNISITATEKARLMREHNIKPGTYAWFKLWFSLPYMTGEKSI